ncbi:MAG: hypothetical protein JWQ84_833 [Mucilaginibacter sp.]|nr:hypothetical protein [Mucilaginibacter sp.]MDB5016001.1 hypothetical protein [Mucilaginibacter sp.]MDB5139667.1 hypothetical protein [Mucilaginibacter sp.]
MINEKNIKDELKKLIVKHLYFFSEQSCSDLSGHLKKNLSLISKLVNELIAEGMVSVKGHAPSSGGRKPQLYSLKADALYILTVAMDQLSTRICLVDLAGKPAAEIDMNELPLQCNPIALTSLAEHLNSYINNSGIEKSKIVGIGIGMPGLINIKEGINFTFLETGGQSLTAYLTKQINVKTYIDNDSSLIALAEQRFGVARTKQDVMVMNLGWGIGLGMIIEGQLYRGHNGFAGEFSHIQLSEGGELCSCGKQGCLESEASMLAVARKAVTGINEGRISSLKSTNLDSYEAVGNAILDAALSGDQFAIELLSDAGYKIGKALATLIHIMNPGTIVFSGRGARVARILLAPIQQAINKYCIPRLVAGTELLISELGFEAQLTGAAILVMENY